MKKQTISVRVHVSLEDIANLLYSARRGTGYWVNQDKGNDGTIDGLGLLEYEKDVEDFVKGKLEVSVFDGEDEDKKHVLTIAKIKKGLTAMAKNEKDQFTDILNDNTDMYTADALVQCALFGKIIYS